MTFADLLEDEEEGEELSLPRSDEERGRSPTRGKKGSKGKGKKGEKGAKGKGKRGQKGWNKKGKGSKGGRW